MLSSLKCTVVSRGSHLAATKAHPQKSEIKCCKYSLQWEKIIIIFLISRICQRLWCPEVPRDSPHWRTLSITEVSHQASRTGKWEGIQNAGWSLPKSATVAVLTGYPNRRDCPHCSKGKAMPAAPSTLQKIPLLPAPWVLLARGSSRQHRGQAAVCP